MPRPNFFSRINLLDTAFAYGTSEEVLGEFLRYYSSLKIVSKFPPPEKGIRIADYFEQSIHRLNMKNLYGYIAHHANSLIQNPELWKELIALKKKGTVSKIGYSLYTPVELERFLDLNMMPDIVQVPFNVFDRRFEYFFPKLQKLNVEIHTRSAFLQGLFFVDPDTLPSFFAPVKSALRDIKKLYSSTKKLSGALLYFCVSNPFVTKVIIGVNNAQQLIQNLESLNSPQEMINWDKFQRSEEQILLPSNWPRI